MRDEERDWEIYHAFQDGKTRTAGDLAALGYARGDVEASLSRLEKAFLVERSGDAVRVLSFQESLLLCQMANDRDSPICIEKGVIRARQPPGQEGNE